MFRGVGAALAAIGLTACTHLSVEIGTPLEAEGEPFLVDQTLYAEVLRRMGPPAVIGSRSRGFTFLYEYARLEERQLSFAASGENTDTLQIFNLVTARARVRRETHMLSFDSQGVLRSQRRQSSDENLGGGFGVQLLVDVSNIVDTSRFRQAPLQHGWGRALLDRPPAALNRRHGSRDGSGLFLLGGPSGIGQETLDMPRAGSSNRR